MSWEAFIFFFAVIPFVLTLLLGFIERHLDGPRL